ncbi:MAG: hypothetical protein HOC74_23190 [Gemmatimonadetes bacterium]|nr:hypothetical protein [Gemmatimonadota bacterium]
MAMLKALPQENPYRSISSNLIRLLRTLNLMDESNCPTSLLQTLWSAAPPPPPTEQASSGQKEPSVPLPRGSFPRTQTASPKAPSDGKTGAPLDIHVGNLRYDVTESQVTHHFQQCGDVIKVTIPKDLVTGKGRGFCFVKMGTRESAKTAKGKLDGSAIGGRRIYLNWSR